MEISRMQIFESNRSFCNAQNFSFSENDLTKRKNILNTQNGNCQVKKAVAYL